MSWNMANKPKLSPGKNEVLLVYNVVNQGFNESACFGWETLMTHIFHFMQVLTLLNYLVVDNKDNENLYQAIKHLDPFPDHPMFKVLRTTQQNIKYSRGKFTLLEVMLLFNSRNHGMVLITNSKSKVQIIQKFFYSVYLGNSFLLFVVYVFLLTLDWDK